MLSGFTSGETASTVSSHEYLECAGIVRLRTYMDLVFVMDFFNCLCCASYYFLDARRGKVWMLSDQGKQGVSEILVH